MINSLNSLNELSDIYLGSISEEDNSPEAIKARVMQHVRAIRYRARKEGETLNKAYNEFMGGQSGISSTEKQMVKERLGLTGGSAHVGEGYQRDPEQSKKDKTHSKQPDPSKDGFTGIGNMSIADIKKMNDRMKKEEVVSEADKKGKGSGKKDACYHKVKASASVWPSAYASGRLVQCRKKGAANYGNSKKESYSWRDELDYVQEGAAWTKKEGKNKSGGLNEKGRKSYERENPGSDLKAPSKKPGNKRRASFCARMKGMKKKLTSAKTSRDPDSRINKSLRAWNC